MTFHDDAQCILSPSNRVNEAFPASTKVIRLSNTPFQAIKPLPYRSYRSYSATGPTSVMCESSNTSKMKSLKGRQQPRVRLQPQPMRALATPQPRVPEPSSRIRSSCGLSWKMLEDVGSTNQWNTWMKLIEHTPTQQIQQGGLHSFWLKTW